MLDKRPGFDKEGLILSIQDFISQSLALLEKTEIGYARQQQHKPNQGTTKLCEEKKQNDIVGVSISGPTSSSMFNVLVEALKTDKDLLSCRASRALQGIVSLLRQRPDLNLCSISSSLEALGQSLGMSSTQVQPNAPPLPYEKWARTVPNLVVSDNINGPEDFLFKTPHIIIEHWLWYLENVILDDFSKTKNSRLLLLGSAVLKLCTQILDLLQFMLLADFHPLRVALHGSSGFYSKAFFRVRAWIKLEFIWVCKNMDVLGIQISPEAHGDDHQYLCRLEQFESSFRSFCFGHYAIAQRTIGSNSIGSAGKDFAHMQRGFLESACAEYNRCKFNFT